MITVRGGVFSFFRALTGGTVESLWQSNSTTPLRGILEARQHRQSVPERSASDRYSR